MHSKLRGVAGSCMAMVFVFGILTGPRRGEAEPPAEPGRAPRTYEAPSVKGAMFVNAITERRRPLIDFALACGTDVNAAGPEGQTPLLAAVASRQLDLVVALLKDSANPDLPDARGCTPLMTAVLQKQEPIVSLLLENSADPTVADKNGYTALHLAMTTRQPALVKQLLESTPEFSGACCKEHDLLGHALETGDWALIELVLTHSPATLQWNRQSRSYLTESLSKRETERVRLLLNKHATAPTPEGRKQPLLAYALLEGNNELFRYMLDCGANPNCPLETPAEKSFLALIPKSTVRNYLAEEPGMNLLMLTAGLARHDDLKLLLEKGARRGIATKSKYKIVPLHFAAWAQSVEAMQILLGNAPAPEQVRIEISIGSQRAQLIKNGIPVLSTSISTGRRGYPTPQGRFVITDKDRSHVSTIYKVKMPFFMRLSCREFGMHEGYAANPFASHGCIRLPAQVARQLYREVPIGTVVTITE
ncbi:MAG: hypothetical protein JWL59_4072 [Chthoniobacteraceae bacterium]|nr:hypothetical protein [Chthoniobacteraceae bacterium]